MDGAEWSIEADLRQLASEVDLLPTLADIWDGEPPDNRDIWYWWWHDQMSSLMVLERLCDSGHLTAEQQTYYCALRRALIEVLPIVQRLGLPTPSLRSAE